MQPISDFPAAPDARLAGEAVAGRSAYVRRRR